jgi:hypothetical protein
MDEESQLDDFLLRARAEQQQTDQLPATPPTDEDIVEEKSRQKSGQLSTTILQNRNQLDEKQIEEKIAASLRKHPELDEIKLRADIAKKIEANGGTLSEAEYARIEHNMLAGIENTASTAKEQQSAAARLKNIIIPGEDQTAASAESIPLISPPGYVAGPVNALQNGTRRLADWGASLATPGGIGFLVAILLFFVWAVVPVNKNGKTRLRLLWGVIVGEVQFAPLPSETASKIGDTIRSTIQTPGPIGGAIQTILPQIKPFSAGGDYY